MSFAEMSKWPMFLAAASIGSIVVGEIAGEFIHRRNLRRTGIRGGVLYARALGTLFMRLFLIAAIIIAVRTRPGSTE